MPESKETIKKHLELYKDDVEWYQQTFPDGSLSSIMCMLFNKFREVTDLTPADYAEIAALEFKLQIIANIGESHVVDSEANNL